MVLFPQTAWQWLFFIPTCIHTYTLTHTYYGPTHTYITNLCTCVMDLPAYKYNTTDHRTFEMSLRTLWTYTPTQRR